MCRNFSVLNISGLFQYYGIPQHYGLFYAMGAALMMEGVLSGCYHVCPNHSNFQFGEFIVSHPCVMHNAGELRLLNTVLEKLPLLFLWKF
jgi:hypothetical protein